MEAESGEPTEPTAAAGYDFHDPAFVTWWLNSLYLLPPADQIAIAQRLRSAVHAKESQREIEAFLEIHANAVGGEDESVEAPVAVPDSSWLGQLRWAWQRRPWLTAVGVGGGAYFVVKGAWFLLEFVRTAG